MGAWILWLTTLAIGAAVLTWAFHREFARLERERRWQLWLEASPALVKFKRDFEEFGRQVGEALLPAMTRMGDSLIAALKTLNQRDDEDGQA